MANNYSSDYYDKWFATKKRLSYSLWYLLLQFITIIKTSVDLLIEKIYANYLY